MRSTSADPGRIVFIGSDATRSGAPMLLLALLRWLRRTHPGLSSELVLFRGGPLVQQFRTVLPTSVVDGIGTQTLSAASAGLRSVGSRRVADWGDRAGDRWALRAVRRADLVVVNTLIGLRAAASTVPGATPLVCLVHELDGVANRVLPPGPVRADLVERVDRFLAAGLPVAHMLSARWGIEPERVRVFEPFVDTPAVGELDRRRARRELGIPVDRSMVVSVGGAGRRKGTDRFIDLIASWPESATAPFGVWIGGDPTSPRWEEANVDLAAAGLERRMRLVPTIRDPSVAVGASDVFISMSREDPFPLALIEAAMLAVPIVATDSGGARSMLDRAGCGEFVVDQGDLLGLRRRVDELLVDTVRHARIAASLSTWALAHHRTVDGAPRLWDGIVASS